MSKLIIKHLKASDLPTDWARQLDLSPDQRVTVRIESEAPVESIVGGETVQTKDPAFGIWKDREDVADVDAYARDLRDSRCNRYE